MQRPGQRLWWVTAAVTGLILLVPVLYLPAHTCLHQKVVPVALRAGKSHRIGFCNGCLFEWLSLFVLAGPVSGLLLGYSGLVPALQPRSLFARPAVSPTGRAPPRLL